MIQGPDIFTLTNILGVFFGLSSMGIVAVAAKPLSGSIRRGMVLMLWGLALVVVSFLAILFGLGRDVQMIALSLGMVMILASTYHLFSLYRPE